MVRFFRVWMLIKQEIQPRMLGSADRFEDSNEKIKRHRNNLLSMLSLKRSILEYEKSPSQKQMTGLAAESKSNTVQLGGGEQKSGKWRQSKTIHTDMSACTSDRLLDRHHQRQQTLSHQLNSKRQRCPTKLSLKKDPKADQQMDLRREIANKINSLRPTHPKDHDSKLLLREGAQSRVGQFMDKYKSNYRMEGRKLTAVDRQHLEIERMANEACNKLKDTSDTAQDTLQPGNSTSPKEQKKEKQKEEKNGRKGLSEANIRPTIKARLQTRRQLPSKTILKQRYQVLEKIGRGLSGEVYKAMDILSDRLVAIKVIAESSSVREEEYEFYKSMQHRNIVTYYNNFKTNGSRYLVLQYFPYTLHRLIKTRPISHTDAKRVFRGIANGLMFLHGLSIAHRDIKLDNIVVSEDLTEVKFIDFGLCIDLSKCEGQLTREFCGTIHYMPPQILQKRAYNPKKADIWSLGVLLYRLLFNRYPFNAKNQFQMLEKIHKTKLVLGECTSDLAHLLEGMLCKNPADRFSILDVLDNKWTS